MAGHRQDPSCDGVKLGDGQAFGIVVIPLSEQFGWSRVTLSTVVLITGVVSSLFQLMIGVLVDRLGPRYVLGAGVACLGVTVWLQPRAAAPMSL